MGETRGNEGEMRGLDFRFEISDFGLDTRGKGGAVWDDAGQPDFPLKTFFAGYVIIV